MNPPSYILIFVGSVCFGVGMLTGQALAAKPIIWIAVMIIAGLSCMAMLIPFQRPRKKRLPRRNIHIVR